MLSATKNFVLTFLIALVIFGLIAYMLVGLILNNILGTSGDETQAPEDTVEAFKHFGIVIYKFGGSIIGADQ